MKKVMPEVRVGDQLILRDVNDRGMPKEVTVTRVGRKYFQISGDRRGKYDKVYWRRVDAHGYAWVTTPEMAALEKARAEAVRELRNLGLECLWSSSASEKAIEVLEAVRPILTKTQNEP